MVLRAYRDTLASVALGVPAAGFGRGPRWIPDLVLLRLAFDQKATPEPAWKGL